MKHLKTYIVFESLIDKKSMGDAIRDILIDLEDEKFKITVYEPYEEEDEESEDEGNYDIHIVRTDENKEKEFKWSEIKQSIEHLMNFAEENFFSPVVTVSIEKTGKFPKNGAFTRAIWDGKKFVNSTFGKNWVENGHVLPKDDDIIYGNIKIELIDDGIAEDDLEEDLYESVESNPSRWPWRDIESMNDILLELRDEGFKIEYETRTNYYTILTISRKNDNGFRQFKYGEIKESVDHLVNYLNDEGYRHHLEVQHLGDFQQKEFANGRRYDLPIDTEMTWIQVHIA